MGRASDHLKKWIQTSSSHYHENRPLFVVFWSQKGWNFQFDRVRRWRSIHSCTPHRKLECRKIPNSQKSKNKEGKRKLDMVEFSQDLLALKCVFYFLLQTLVGQRQTYFALKRTCSAISRISDAGRVITPEGRPPSFLKRLIPSHSPDSLNTGVPGLTLSIT